MAYTVQTITLRNHGPVRGGWAVEVDAATDPGGMRFIGAKESLYIAHVRTSVTLTGGTKERDLAAAIATIEALALQALAAQLPAPLPPDF